MEIRAQENTGDLIERVRRYLEAHHTMTIATCDPERNIPHAACVFYAVDENLRLTFLSKLTSTHALHIGSVAPVAVTVTEDYVDWEAIQGVQLWGEVRRLAGMAKTRALARYVQRFPFVKELLARKEFAELVRNLGVYEVVPRRVALTDNTTGCFGREVLELGPVED
ncbi:MAG: pyridoxamine 5'-phosphate oxidase family protein [Thermoleophilia bacterium]|nr:pyridoxamine 5'-phosphate oxidase family protein [Thermoleophilia bacterium]